MRIRFFANLRDFTGAKEITWTPSSPTVGALIDDLCARYGPEFSKWFREDGNTARWMTILVNGNDYRNLDGMDSRLKDDDTVCIFPPVAGG